MPRYARVWALRAMPEPPGVKGVLLISAGAVLSQSQISEFSSPEWNLRSDARSDLFHPGYNRGDSDGYYDPGPLCGAAFVVGRMNWLRHKFSNGCGRRLVGHFLVKA